MDITTFLPEGWQVKPTADKLLILATHRKEVHPFLDIWLNEVRATAEKLGRVIEIVTPDGKRPIPIKPTKTTGRTMLTITPETIASVQQQSTGFFRSKKLPVLDPLIPAMVRMVESERPMFLTRDDDDQLWLNQLAADMLRSSGQEATQRNMKDYVEDESLSRMHQRLRDASHGQVFEHRYRAKLNDEHNCPWFEAVGQYEIFLVNNRSYRLATTLDFKLLGQMSLATYR